MPNTPVRVEVFATDDTDLRQFGPSLATSGGVVATRASAAVSSEVALTVEHA